MLAFLYLETNFILSFATGRSQGANALLTEPINPIQLAIPNVCFMEAFSVLKAKRKSHKDLERPINDEIRESRRNVVFPDFPSSLIGHLEAVLIDRRRTFDLFERLLFTAITVLCTSGEVLQSPWDAVSESLSNILLEDPTDNLILTSILRHARSHPSEAKAFLSENHKDFNKPDAKKALELAGVKYFRDAGHCMGWLKSRIGS